MVEATIVSSDPSVRLETQVIPGDDRFARKLAEHPLLAPYVGSVEDFVSE
jgi:hypothetical protein